MSDYLIRCYECAPVREFDAVTIFTHWRDVHGLHFDVFEVDEEGERTVILQDESPLIVYEAQLDDLAAKVHLQPFWIRPWYWFAIWKVRRQVAALRSHQIEHLLRSPFP